MEENAPASSANICRICLTANPETRSLFANLSDEGRTLSELFTFVTNIHVKPEDMFSKQICGDCEVCLYQLDKFKRRCIENEAKLQSLLLGSPFSTEATSIKNEIVSRPYQCSLCYMQYTDVVELQTHVFSIHETKGIDKVKVTLELDEKGTNDIKQEVTDSSEYLEDTFADHETFDTLPCEVDVEVDKKPYIPKDEENETKLKCNLCNTHYKTKKSYRNHIRNFHETPIKPDNSDNTDSESPKLTRYESKLLKVTKFKCELCGTYYKNQHSYRKHIRKKHEKRLPVKQIVKPVKFDKHQCSHCMRQFVKKSTLIAHLRRHEAKTSHICALCKREFIHKAHLDNHMLSIHATSDGLKCNVCDSSFPTPESLEIHRSSHDSLKKHQCNICSKSFHMLSTLKDHERVHTGERPYLCPTCGKGFTQNTNLQEHMRRHAGIKPFSCELCPRRFVAKGELAAHMRKHSGAHPFVCVECGGRFTTSSSLVKHKRTHSGERPYACDLCHMRFAASGTLKNHRRTHTGEKPYKCNHCDKAFVQKNDLTSHTRCHTGERPYVCPTCGQAFRQSSALKTHLKMHPLL